MELITNQYLLFVISMAAQYIKHVNISIHKILSNLKSYENKAYIFFLLYVRQWTFIRRSYKYC